jgi:hypothetical protein
MKRTLVLFAAAATLALAGTAAAGSKSKGIDYAAYAGEPVQQITYFQLYNWQRSTDKMVVLWTKPSTAYVLELRNRCYELGGPRAVIQVGGVAATPGRLSVNDDLIVGEMKCKISAIRPVDLEAIKRDRKAKSA